MRFSENLLRLMTKEKESNYRLAKKLNVSQTTIANWISGKNKPMNVYVEKLAAHYGVPVSEIIDEECVMNAEDETITTD